MSHGAQSLHDASPLPTDADRSPGPLTELREIGRDLLRYRFLLQQLALRDIRLRYKQAVLGFFWAVFMPALVVAAGVALRYATARLAGTGVSRADVAGIAVKALPWAFFVGTLQFATTSLATNTNLVTKVYFPREVLPLAAVIAQVFDTSIGALVLLLILPFLGVTPAASQLWVPVLGLLILLLASASALVLSCANLFFRDVKYIVQVLLTFGIFFTPVFFEPGAFGEAGGLLLMLNPLAPLLEGLRLSIIEGRDLLTAFTDVAEGGAVLARWTPWYLAYSAAWAVGGVLLGALVFHRLEGTFAENA